MDVNESIPKILGGVGPKKIVQEIARRRAFLRVVIILRKWRTFSAKAGLVT